MGPSLLSGIVVLVVFWRRLIAKIRAWRWTAWSALALSLVVTVFLHIVVFLRLPLKYDPLRRAEGWLDFAQHLQKARQRTHPDLLIGSDRVPASMMQFYLPDHPFAYVQPEAYGKSQFTLCPAFTADHGTRAPFVPFFTSTPRQKLNND